MRVEKGVKLLDEYLTNLGGASSSTYQETFSSLEHTEILSRSTQSAFQVVVNFSSTTPLRVIVQMEHSSTGRVWTPKNAAPEIEASASTGPLVASGGEAWPVRPNLRYVRLHVRMRALDGLFSAKVQVHATFRSQVIRAPRPDEGAVQRPPHGEHHAIADQATLAEVGRLVQEARMLRRDPTTHVLRRATPKARAEIERISEALRTAQPDKRRMLVELADDLARNLSRGG